MFRPIQDKARAEYGHRDHTGSFAEDPVPLDPRCDRRSTKTAQDPRHDVATTWGGAIHARVPPTSDRAHVRRDRAPLDLARAN